MKYCQTCLQPDTRPDEHFRDDGVCSACVAASGAASIDWLERHHILEDLLARRTRRPGQLFDCIVGVSGGKDSLRQALYVRDKLGLRALLACLTYPPQQVTTIGVDNLSNLIEHGFDVVVCAPAPGTWRRAMRAAFLRFANFCRSTELALYSSVPQLALRYNIPLIFTGENQSLRDRRTLSDRPWDYNAARHMNTLAGGDMTWLFDEGFALKDVLPYRYPTVAEFDSAGLQIIDLGWFIGDWSNRDNGTFSCAHGLRIRAERIESTGDPLGISALDEDWVTLNQMIKYYKYGYGKVTDYVNEDIRMGRTRRKDAIPFVEQYDGTCADGYVESFCDFIEITVDEFWARVRASANPRLFDLAPDGTLRPRFKVGVGLSAH